MRQLRGWLVAVGMLVPVAAAAQGGQGGQGGAPRLLTVDDLFALKEAGDPQISPDGRWVAYTVTTTDLKAEKSESRLGKAPLAGGEGGAVPLTVPGSSASAPGWSPDGRYVSFLAARKTGAPGDSEPKTQVGALDRRGGEARPLTHVREGVEAYEWSADGSKLVLVIRDTFPTWTSSKAARPWVITRLQFKRDEVGYLDTLRTHLYVFIPASNALTQITSGNYDDAEPAWSPDGKSIAFASNRRDRKSTRLNSSHGYISYAVFCLKKKNLPLWIEPKIISIF